MRCALTPETAPPAAPLGADEFAALMERFAPFGTGIAIAVSGGPDSMALALCAGNWAAAHGIACKAFIVDHGLRPESAAEAERVKKTLSGRGIENDSLRWEHAPVVARLHSAARKARYRLLHDACRNSGFRDLLLAHQREDQAETILMRLAKGSGVHGLGGMRPESRFEDIRLLRPLLAIPKARLIATCQAARLPFVTDPSNRSEKFARGRLRRVMPLLAEEGLTVERLTDLGARAAEASDAIDHYAGIFLRAAARRDEAGAVALDRDPFRALPRAVAARALAACLQSVHAEDYDPEYAALAALLDRLAAGDAMPARTLHGCLVSETPAHITIMREATAITETLPIRPGETVVWDGRWQVRLGGNEPGGPYMVRPLGNPPHDLLDRLSPGLRRKVPQGRARASLPALWRNDEIALIPALDAAQKTLPLCATATAATPWPPLF